MSSVQRYQTEKAIIDALLKISEIIKKTTRTNRHSKKTTGDGDKKQQRNEYDYDEIYDVPVPRSTRTLGSSMSGVNQQYAMSSSQRASNCNQAPVIGWNPPPYDKRFYSSSKRRKIYGNYRERESAYKRRCYDISSSSSVSSVSENHPREKSLRHHAKRKLSGSNKIRRLKCKCYSPYDDYDYTASHC